MIQRIRYLYRYLKHFKLSSFENKRKNFGLYTALESEFKQLIDIICLYRTHYYQELVTNYISPLCIEAKRHLVKDNINQKALHDRKKIPVWVCWWQGVEQAPIIVQECIRSQKKYLDEEIYDYIIITNENLMSYLSIPDYILQKVSDGKITLTHFSDIIRSALLFEYGGVWLDATLYMTDQIPSETISLNLFSNRKKAFDKSLVSQGRWSAYFWICKKNHELFQFLRDFFYIYWENNNTLIDYFLIDYAVAWAYENIDRIRTDIDAIPYNNPEIFKLFRLLKTTYSETEYMELCKDNYIHKLSYKDDFGAKNCNAHTYYSELFEKREGVINE